jgi:hypothetical protein
MENKYTTLTIKREELKKEVLKKIEDAHWGIGLYALEKLFKKECMGHGAGRCGEDIYFVIYGKNITFIWDEKKLEVAQYHEKTFDYENIDPKVVAYILRKLVMD